LAPGRAQRTGFALGHARLVGWFEPQACSAPFRAVVEQDVDQVRLSCAGLQILADARYVRWVTGPDHLVLWVGRPVVAGRALDSAQQCDPQRPEEVLLSAAESSAHPPGGRFAILHFDGRNRTATLSTDRFAVHPLCYATVDGKAPRRIVFSDRADAVARFVGAGIDPQAIFEYVYFHVIPAPRTVFQGVSRLPAARRLIFGAGGTTVEPSWTPVFVGSERRVSLGLRDQFHRLLAQSVEREIGGDSNVGAFLSGGTDSSTVAGMACRLTGRALPTFSIGFDQAGYDEMEYARIAARHFGTEHHEFYLSPKDLVDHSPAVAAYYDQPFGNSSALPAYYCARMAGEAGIGRLLAGDGGDELFGGNTRYAKQRLFGAYWTLPATLRTGIVEPLFVDAGLVRRLPLLRKLRSYVEQARVPMPQRTETYNLLLRFGAEAVFAPAFLAAVDTRQPALLQQQVFDAAPTTSLVDQMLFYDWRFTLSDNDLPKVTQTCQMAGRQVGFPLLSDELVDFSLRLSPSLKVRGLTLRYFFKQALTDFLPPQIIAKKKHGFGLPFGYWVRQHADLNSLSRASVMALAQRGIVQPRLVEELFSRRLGEHPGFFGELIWILMMAEQWLSAHAPSFEVN
jgi:asparagine synthase (glutamine-hydrolysing)